MPETAVERVEPVTIPEKVSTRVDRPGLLAMFLLGAAFANHVSAESWSSYAANKANWKYSPLAQITEENASSVKEAWRWTPPDADILKRNPGLRTWKFEATPILVGTVLYLSTPLNQIAAIDSGSGKTIWVHDPHAYSNGMPVNFGFTQRGVSYWSDGKEWRIISGTVDGYLIALDAKTGKPIEYFGKNGRIDLTQGLGRPVSRALYGVNSPPIICRDVVIVGSAVMDSPVTKPMPPGDVRGFDVRTGRLLWSFHTIPHRGEYGSTSWSANPDDLGAANVWAPMAADDSLGYVYLPVSSPSGDFYGGDRPGDGLFGDTLLCLDAKSGKRIWHFQLVHHDLWDRDPPAAPIITNREVVQVTKQGFVYVFDRVTGKPIWPVVERPVPTSQTLGEQSAATQPIPTRPIPFDLQGISVKDLIDFTPELKREASDLLARFDHGPLFTPPTERGTILVPGVRGGASWSGAAYDPETDTVFVPSITAPSMIQLHADQWLQWPKPSFRAGQLATLTLRNGLPITKPPYGRVTAISLGSGDRFWMQPVGNGPVNHPALRDLRLKRLGWPYRAFPLVTKTLLLIAQEGDLMKTSYRSNGQDGLFSDVEPSIQVFNKKDGTLIAEIPLPANASGSPITYTNRGAQFIVIATGGGNRPAELVGLKVR